MHTNITFEFDPFSIVGLELSDIFAFENGENVSKVQYDVNRCDNVNSSPHSFFC